MTTLRTAAKAALWAFQCHVEMTWPTDRSTAAIANLRAALAQQEEPSQEPVAWLIDYEDGEREVRFVAGTRGITQTPLYAAAPTAKPVAWMTDRKEMYFDKDDALRYSDSIIQPLYLAPPQRKPLAEWQINDLMADIDPEDVCSWSFRQGVYAAEKHHGVKP